MIAVDTVLVDNTVLRITKADAPSVVSVAKAIPRSIHQFTGAVVVAVRRFVVRVAAESRAAAVAAGVIRSAEVVAFVIDVILAGRAVEIALVKAVVVDAVTRHTPDA